MATTTPSPSFSTTDDDGDDFCGYDFFETFINRADGSILAPSGLLSNGLKGGRNGASDDSGALRRAHNLFCSIGSDVTTAVVLGSSTMMTTGGIFNDDGITGRFSGEPSSSSSSSCWQVSTLLRAIPDDGSAVAGFDDDSSKSTTVHRLCRYAAAPAAAAAAPSLPSSSPSTSTTGRSSCCGVNVEEAPQRKKQKKENLRSHTDWTLTTIVPVSDVTGLEIWRSMSSSKSWIRPEGEARRHYWEATKHRRSAPLDNDASWNAHYVVVMAGKWLELLTHGKVESAVHRVVALATPPQAEEEEKKGEGVAEWQEARLSAPLFLTPRRRYRKALAERAVVSLEYAMDWLWDPSTTF